MRIKPIVTDIQEWIGIKPMILIYTLDNIYWTPDNPTINLEGIYHQQFFLNFNGWMKSTQQSTGNMKTKPTVTDKKNE